MCYNFHFNNYVGLSIEIQVNGTATTRTQFCIGEIVSFVYRHDTSIYAGLSLKPASAVLYRTTFPTKKKKNLKKKKKKKSQPRYAGLRERITINRIRL